MHSEEHISLKNFTWRLKMKIELVIERVLLPGVPLRAYQLVFGEDVCYFLHLSADWVGFGAKAPRGGIENAAANMILSSLGARSESSIAQKLKELESHNFDEYLTKDKKSVKLSYGEITAVKHKKKSLLSGEAYFQFKTKKGNYKFRLYSEAEREAIAELISRKRSDLLQ